MSRDKATLERTKTKLAEYEEETNLVIKFMEFQLSSINKPEDEKIRQAYIMNIETKKKSITDNADFIKAFEVFVNSQV